MESKWLKKKNKRLKSSGANGVSWHFLIHVNINATDLAEQMAGKDATDHVFTAPGGGPLRLSNWRARVFDPAVRSAYLGDDEAVDGTGRSDT